MNRSNRYIRSWFVLAVGAVCLTFALSGSSQVQTQTSTTTGQSSKELKVDHAQVVDVIGNDLIVKMEDGTIRHIANVPESARVTVDGKQLGIHDLKAGMTLQRTIVTTTTPKVITTTQTVTGKVWHVQPPSSVILTLEDGTNQQFKIPKGQKFNVDGQMVDAWGLKKGMKVSATKVVEEPITQVEHARHLTGQMPPAPTPPTADAPILVAVEASPAAAPTATEGAPAALPKTGSELPLYGLLGILSLASAFGLRLIRKAA
ncbi:LPXTG cell wall anchor domain-containing protein [Acidobacterium sp. S8]|uniref:LPXTG cell wall anchor domain-containing protein n=1 Tax=Acidobacterium sp. S8 TaxID=1641854 RepID=UPI00131DACCF|nr:LPXTG cell wall anchor domain-containing protein [Acidobacterium sp. S8]